MVPKAASVSPTARAASSALSATTICISGSAVLRRDAQARVVAVCGGNIRSVVGIASLPVSSGLFPLGLLPLESRQRRVIGDRAVAARELRGGDPRLPHAGDDRSEVRVQLVR